jgi:hypothetical protein
MGSLRREQLHRSLRCIALGSVTFIAPAALAADLTIPNTFVSGTPATAADVNANFSATQTAVNSKQNRVTGSCPTGQAIRGVNQDGSVICQPTSVFGGDGSAGNLTIAAATDWNSAPPANPNFANVTINPGQTLTVPAGTIIRCSGSFTNSGTLAVSIGAQNSGTSFFTDASGSSAGAMSVAGPGDTPRAAVPGAMDNGGAARSVLGGPGGIGIPQAVARTAFGGFRVGGGAGAGPFDSGGAGGGGLVKIYCEGPIANTGTINALGGNANFASFGGGGGGIVVLASRTSVSNAGGTINVSGGLGGSSNATWGAVGGGGGGGIIIMASPAAPVSGTQVVTGGSPGTAGAALTTVTRTGGSGGGASGGAGGSGGGTSGSTPLAGSGGAAGYVITMTLDPSAIAR